MTFPLGPHSSHIGDPDNSRVGMPPAQSDVAHYRSDTDVSAQSKHHTLGTNAAQAAPGNHIHDGTNSPKLGLYQMDNATGAVTPTLTISGAKGGNAAVASIIVLLKNFLDFTDNTTA